MSSPAPLQSKPCWSPFIVVVDIVVCRQPTWVRCQSNPHPPPICRSARRGGDKAKTKKLAGEVAALRTRNAQLEAEIEATGGENAAARVATQADELRRLRSKVAALERQSVGGGRGGGNGGDDADDDDDRPTRGPRRSPSAAPLATVDPPGRNQPGRASQSGGGGGGGGSGSGAENATTAQWKAGKRWQRRVESLKTKLTAQSQVRDFLFFSSTLSSVTSFLFSRVPT